MGAMASQITSLTIVYSTIYSDFDQRKHQSSASLAFVRGIHLWPVNSPHKWPVKRKMFPFDDVMIESTRHRSYPFHCSAVCSVVLYSIALGTIVGGLKIHCYSPMGAHKPKKRKIKKHQHNLGNSKQWEQIFREQYCLLSKLLSIDPFVLMRSSHVFVTFLKKNTSYLMSWFSDVIVYQQKLGTGSYIIQQWDVSQ